MLRPPTLFCHNFVDALALPKTGEGGRRLSSRPPPHPQPPPTRPLLPILLYYCLTTSSQTPPTPSQLICHLHSSPQDNSNEPKEATSKVWDHSWFFQSFSSSVNHAVDQSSQQPPPPPLALEPIRNLISHVEPLKSSSGCWCFHVCSPSSKRLSVLIRLCAQRKNTVTPQGKHSHSQRIVSVFHLSLSLRFKPVIYSCFFVSFHKLNRDKEQ